MIEIDAYEDGCKGVEYKGPRIYNGHVEMMLQQSCQRHKGAVDEYHGKAIERVAQTHILRLVVSVEFYHVEAVRRDVVCGTGERHQEQESHRTLEPQGCGQREGNAGKGATHKQLHCQHPPTLSLEKVDERAPQRLYHPWQGEPAGIESHLRIAKPHLHIHNNGEGCDDHIGQAFRKV